MTDAPTIEPAAAASKALSLGEELKAKEKNFLAALPAHIPVERFARVVMTAVQNNPSLWHADRASLWNASMRAAQDGLLPDGREGALVIYKTKEKDEHGRERWISKVQWLPMIAGLRKKVRNSGEIKDWNAQVVHLKDEFEFELGDEPFIKHKPFLAGDRGPIVAAYSIARFATGELSREVMTRSEIEKVRSVSKAKGDGPWTEWFEEMCRKTVARRHAKSLPMSTDLDDLLRRDDDLYDFSGKSDRAVADDRPRSLGGKLSALAEPPPPASLAKFEDAIRADPPAKSIAQQQLEASVLADLIATGDARATAGQPALQAFLDGLTETEAKLITDEQRMKWTLSATPP